VIFDAGFLILVSIILFGGRVYKFDSW
jgi:hypothetical protein